MRNKKEVFLIGRYFAHAASDNRGVAAFNCLLLLLIIVNMTIMVGTIIIQREQAISVEKEFESMCKVALSEATNKDYLVDHQGMEVASETATFIDENGNTKTESVEAQKSAQHFTKEVYSREEFGKMLYKLYADKNNWVSSGKRFVVSENIRTHGMGDIIMYGVYGKDAQGVYKIHIRDAFYDMENGYVSLIAEIAIATKTRVLDQDWPDVTFRKHIRIRDTRVDYNAWNQDLSLDYQANSDGASMGVGVASTKSQSVYETSEWFNRNYMRQAGLLSGTGDYVDKNSSDAQVHQKMIAILTEESKAKRGK